MSRSVRAAGGELERLVERAREGDARALDELVRAIQDGVYNLAVRMLWHPEDAEDATQEILLKVVTRLASFRGESAFRTWVYRVATNHLLNVRKSRVEREELSFAEFGEQLGQGLGDAPAPAAAQPDQAILAEEMKIACTTGMLLCLDREHRIAYVLGEVFQLSGEEAAQVLELEPATFRKRLSRARERLRRFMRGHCGLIDAANPCRCARRITPAIEAGRVDPKRLLFAEATAADPAAVTAGVETMETLERIAALYRSHPRYRAPDRLVPALRRLLRLA